MSRSLYKLPYIHRSLWEKSIKSRIKIKYKKKMMDLIIPAGTVLEKNLYFWKRGSLLNNSLIKSNKTIGVYNGFAFIIMHLNNNTSNYKLGQFSVTRRSPRHKGKQKQQKKQNYFIKKKINLKYLKKNKYHVHYINYLI